MRDRGWPSLAIVVRFSLAILFSACGAWQEPPPGSPGLALAGSPKDHPDDEVPSALVPAGVQTVIDVDMAAVRRSAWTASILEGRDPKARATKTDALGYDEFADVDRIIYAVTSAGADAPTLVIARGRFQPARVEDAFRARWSAAVVDKWRGIVILFSGENAIAFLTPRTFISGTPSSVRVVVDRAFGVGADVGADPALGPTRRALCPEGAQAKPAILATIAVDDRMRARVGDTFPLPRELRQVGLRVDAGQSLDLHALGILDDRKAASGLARRLGIMLGDPATRLGLRVMGLGMLLPQTRVILDGARVHVRTSIADEDRAQVTAAVRVLMESLGGGGSAGGATGPGSW